MSNSNYWEITRFQGNTDSLYNDQNEEYYTLILISYGKSMLQLGADTASVSRGDLFLLPPRTPYKGYAATGGMVELYRIFFALYPAELAELDLPASWHVVRPIAYDLLLDKVKALLGEQKDGLPFHYLLGRGLLLEIIALWSRERAKGALAPSGSRHIERMKTYIQDHYRQHVTKEDLGICISRTPNYAATLFRSGTGQTISEYVHAVRMKTAVYMLQESLLTVEEIAEYLGYAEISYFQRIFKRTYGASPSMYASRIQ